MDTDDGWPRVWAEMSDEERRDRGSGIIYFSRQTVRLKMQNASRNSWPKPTSVGRLKWRMRRGSGSRVTNRRNKGRSSEALLIRPRTFREDSLSETNRTHNEQEIHDSHWQ